MNDEPAENPSEDGAVYALAASPAYASDGVCYAATARGLLVSTSGAELFRDAYGSLNLPEALPTPAVALSPSFQSDGSVFAGVHGAVLHSRDRGVTWHYSELRTPPPVVTCLAVSPHYEHDGIVFAGTLQDGVFRSADRGSRWASWNFGLVDLRVLCFALSPAFAEDETLVAGAESGLFRSTNGGRAWRELGLPTDLAPVLSLAFSPGYAKNGLLFAGTESNGLWASHDRGRSWGPIDGLGDGAVNALLAATVDEKLALAALAGDEILISPDAGQAWHTVAGLAESTPLCLAAPLGLDAGAPLLVGCADGTVKQLRL